MWASLGHAADDLVHLGQSVEFFSGRPAVPEKAEYGVAQTVDVAFELTRIGHVIDRSRSIPLEG